MYNGSKEWKIKKKIETVETLKLKNFKTQNWNLKRFSAKKKLIKFVEKIENLVFEIEKKKYFYFVSFLKI